MVFDNVVGNDRAFAAVKEDGSVDHLGVVAYYGGNSDSVKSELSGGVDRVVGTGYAFAAVKHDGSVVTWGDADCGGNSDERQGSADWRCSPTSLETWVPLPP